MENELIAERRWWQKRRWYVAALLVVMAFILVFFIGGLGHAGDFAKAYTDKPLFEKAAKMAGSNQQVAALLGEVEPLGSMAIAEGAVEYTPDGHAVTATITLKGSKTNGKMDIAATKVNGKWQYESITVRTKKPEQTIKIFPAE